MMVARDPESGGRIAFAIPVGVLSRDSSVVQATLPTPMELDGAAGSHLDASARGVKAGEAGWLFTGRKRALSDLVAWLTSDDGPAIRVVTDSRLWEVGRVGPIGDHKRPPLPRAYTGIFCQRPDGTSRGRD
jgi:hypothetical protein